MYEDVNSRLLQLVQQAKESAAKAEREYERREDALQAKASQNIDLFGGHAVSQAVDLAAEARKMCDSLYAAYQTLVAMTDAQCRPLLAQQPGREAVRAVRDLIKWLNDESEIENNFSASLNYRDLGEFASVRYIPKLENKMIQSFWENAYATLPGVAEAERQEKDAAESEKQRAARERAENYRKSQAALEAQKAQYQQELESWKAAVEAAKQQQAAMLKNLENQERSRLTEDAEQLFEAQTKSAMAELEEKKEALLQANVALQALGFFQFGEKKRQKDAIEKLTAQIDKLEHIIEDAKIVRDRAKRAIPSAIFDKKQDWQAVAEQAYPIPEEPLPPGMTQEQREKKKTEDAIYNTLKAKGRMRVEDLLEKCPAVKGWTDIRLRATLRSMGDRVFTEEIKYMLFYSAAPEKDPQEQAREDQKHMDAIVEYLRQNGTSTIGEISENCMDVVILPIQKVSHLTYRLYNQGILHRLEKDRKAYFEVV